LQMDGTEKERERGRERERESEREGERERRREVGSEQRTIIIKPRKLV
jgi:hypothetical protein